MMTTWSSVLQVPFPAVLPEGFAIPSLIYVVPVLLALALVSWLVYAVRPPITDYTALAITPWIGVGAALHVLYQQPAFYESVRPLFGTPMVYLTTAVFAGAVWFFAEVVAEMRDEVGSADRYLGIIGTGVLIVAVVYSLYVGTIFGTLRPLWPVIGIALSAMGAAFAWVAVSLIFTDTATVVARTGTIVVFGHVLDGVSTAMGVDFFPGISERTPFSAFILEVSAQLPTAEVIGTGWLFLLVKLLLAVFVVIAFTGYVEDDPEEARLVLTVVAALGLGPGAHNMLLFTVVESLGAI